MTETEARSRTAEFLWSIPSKFARERLNGPIHANCNILTFIAASTADAETGGCFVTGGDVIILLNT